MKQDKLRKQLQAQTKEWLIDRLCDFAADDRANADRLSLYFAAQNSDQPHIVKHFTSKLDEAVEEIRDHGPYDWKDRLPTESLSDVAHGLAELVLKDNPVAVLDIAECALSELDSIAELQDECELDYVIDRFRRLHLEACHMLKPDPVEFGNHLADLANKSEWGLFDGPPKGYAKLLGKRGLAAYAAGLEKKR